MYGIFTALIGTAFSILIRLELSAPGSQFLAGNNQVFNVIITAHGLIMVLFMVVPTMSGFANYMVPVLIGAPDGTSSKPFSTMPTESSLGAYLAGLWEGDGHIWISTTTHRPSGKRYTPHFCITFSALDHVLALKLQSILGGYLRDKTENNAYVLSITDLGGLANIINLICPYVRTPKLNQLNNLINWMNSNTNSTFNLVSPCTNDIFNDSWLAGFIDADGSFDIKIRLLSEGAAKDRVEVRFRLEQRMTDPKTGDSYKPILSVIAAAFNVVLNTSIHHGVEYYIIAITSPVKHMLLISYLNNHRLMTHKYLNFIDYSTCANMMINKEHLSPRGRIKAKVLKDGMNSKRTVYTWDHLNDSRYL
jgi:hypothetical protein